MLKLLALLAAFTIFTLLFYSTFTPQQDGLTAPWLSYFASFSFVVPVLIVDVELLRSISVGASPPENDTRKLIVAVEENYRGVKVSRYDQKLTVIYYSKLRDYWLFTAHNETNRAMLPFDLISSSFLFLPAHIRGFLDDWNASRFIECQILIDRDGTENRTIPLSFISHLSDLRDFIKQRRARLMLAGGTLLGWYRECSLIPHTTDIDFFIRAEEYTPAIKDDLDARTSPYKLFRVYGTPSDSYELAVNVKGEKEVNIDLFLLYTDANESYVGGLAWYTRQKYKWTYPRITELCTADLLGHLFYVPCNAKEVLDTEYGNWREDSPSTDFVWYKSHRNVKENGVYTEKEMEGMRAFELSE